jgi:hypothetical protein
MNCAVPFLARSPIGPSPVAIWYQTEEAGVNSQGRGTPKACSSFLAERVRKLSMGFLYSIRLSLRGGFFLSAFLLLFVEQFVAHLAEADQIV